MNALSRGGDTKCTGTFRKPVKQSCGKRKRSGRINHISTDCRGNGTIRITCQNFIRLRLFDTEHLICLIMRAHSPYSKHTEQKISA